MIQMAIGKVNDLEQNQPLCGNMREYRAGPRTPRLFAPIKTGNRDGEHPEQLADYMDAHDGFAKLGTFAERNRKGDKCLSTKDGIGSLSSAEQKSTNSITATNTTSLQPKDQHGLECGQSDLKTSALLEQEFKVGDLVECLPDEVGNDPGSSRGDFVGQCLRIYGFTTYRFIYEKEIDAVSFAAVGNYWPVRALRRYKSANFEKEPQEQDGWIEQKDHVHGARLWANNQKGVWLLDNGLWETSDGPKQYPDWPSCKASIRME